MIKIDKKDFVRKILVGGLIIILPVALLVMGLRFLFKFVTDLIQTPTDFVTKTIGWPEVFADLLVLACMAGICFAVGWFVTTAGGSWLHSKFENVLARYAPIYKMLKDMVGQFLGDESQSPLANGEVALVKIFGPECETTITAIVTSKHQDGSYTIYQAISPMPFSGLPYHVKKEQVQILPDVSVADAMRTIIACGAGSGELLNKYTGDESSLAEEKTETEERNFNRLYVWLTMECAKFLEDCGVIDDQSLASFHYEDALNKKGFKTSFIKEISNHLLTCENNIDNNQKSDWLPVEALDLGKRTNDILAEDGIICVGQLEMESRKEAPMGLIRIPGIGNKTVPKIQEKIKAWQNLD